MATTSSMGGGADDRVMATAQQIVKSLNTSKNVREDMLLILSSFDNRLSNITDLIKDESNTFQSRLDAAEKVIYRYESASGLASSRHFPVSFDESPEEATEYLSTVDEVLDLLDELSIRSDAEIVDRAESALQAAMTRLEDEFRNGLIRNAILLDDEGLYGSIRRVSLSLVPNEVSIGEEGFDSFREETESPCYHERGASLGDNLCVDLINPGSVPELKDLADRIIRSGYERECVQAYSSVRKLAHDECLVNLGVEKLSIEEVQKFEWKLLDEKMKKWTQAVKIGVKVLLAGEKRLCDQIFSSSDAAKEVCFNEIAKWFLMPLLNFGQAVAIVKRSSEKLFRILDMYDVLCEVLPDLDLMLADDFVYSEAKGVLDRLGDAARGTFAEFEKNVQNECSKKPMVNGDIHPLTRYVMNYIKLVVDYGETLSSLLETYEDDNSNLVNTDDGEGDHLENFGPLARRLAALLSILEANLHEKAKLYEDSAIQYIFLMNNLLYMVQKVKDSELKTVLGDQWVRTHGGQIRQYAKAYLRAAWGKALNCLRDEGIGGSSSNASKMALKERFKTFNLCFEDIYRVQTAWKVPDSQLREELRISISEVVIPAYRSFLGRFGSQLEGGRNASRYIKYTTDDLLNYLPDLYEGTPQVLHHIRRKST